MKRISQLDGLRGLAVLAVVFFHLGPFIGDPVRRNRLLIVLDHIASAGWLGVDIFFVLSGFLITGILLKERSKPDFWNVFYARRAFRILPPFIAVFAVVMLAAHFFSPEVHVSVGYVLVVIFFMANWVPGGWMLMLSHLWSLAVEEQFYLLWPQAVKRLTNLTLLKLTLFLAIACELLRFVLDAFHVRGITIYKITPTHIDGLSIGAALASGIALPGVRRFLGFWWRRMALVAAAALLLVFLAQHGNLSYINVRSQILAIPPAIVLTAMLVYGAIESALPVGLAKFFGSPVMTYLGRRSYALYLIHVPIFVAVETSHAHGRLQQLPHIMGVDAVLVVSVVAVSLVLTEISWRLIESPAQNLRRSWMRGNEGAGQHVSSREY